MNSKQTTETSASSQPWAQQQPYLLDAWKRASGQLDASNQNVYGGDHVAGFNPDQLSTFQKMLQFGNGSTVPGQTASAGGSLVDSGMGALGGAMGSLGGYKPTGGVDSNIAAARAYADNQDISGQVDASMRDARRTVSETAMPSIARQAASGGNTFSSKRAISEGLVERGLAEKTADVSAGLRGQAFNTGLGLAEQGRQFDNTSMLDAAKSLGSLGSGATGAGLGALGSSLGQQGSLFDMMQGGGAGMRDASQAGLDNERAKTEYGTGTNWDNLMKYYSMIGGQNWGGEKQGTETKERQPGAMEWAGLGLSLFKK